MLSQTSLLRAITLGIAVLGTAVCSLGDDWPQWLGPKRDSQWRETGVLQEFPASGVKVLWRAPIAGGYAGPAVADGRVFVADYLRESGDASNDPGQRRELKGKERILCFDAASGKQLWKHEYDCPYNISYPSGPRATPTVVGGKVYALGAEGNLHCLDAKSGDVIWKKDFKHDYKATTPIWGFCGHPLVDGQKLICLVGGPGSIAVAFDKDTGKELWRALSAPEQGYCPPTMIEAGGTKQLLIWHVQALNSLNPDTGEVYWSEPLAPAYNMPITAPRQAGDYLFASGIGSVAALYNLDRKKPAVEVVWNGDPKTAVYCANSTPIIDRGIIYAADCQVGCLRAVQLSDGKRLWETFQPTTGGERRDSHGTAFLVQNGDRYFLFSETGDLIIARLSAEKYEELSRAHLLEPTGESFRRPVVWSHPAFASRCCFARNDKEIVCVSLAAE